MESPEKRVLCVDDDLNTLKLRKTLLSTAGYSVLTANSGAEAIKMVAEGIEVDLVLLDYLMPGMNGDELAGRLRTEHPLVRLIAVSAVGQLPPAFLQLVDANVQKGHDPEVLLATVASVLERPAGERANGQSAVARTILCVEDEKLQLHLRKLLFESAGFKVLEAQTASSALEQFRSQHIDAVVMDYWLSGTNGTAIAEEMKRLSPRTPIVMLSGFSSLPGEAAIVDAWLRKAEVQPEELIEEVTRLIDRHRDLRQTASSE